MKKELYYTSSNGSDTIYASIYTCENPKIIVQILHGMCEHIERYENFADFLNEHNIIMAGNNHLGHGKTASKLGFFSSENSLEYAISDINILSDKLKQEYNLPIVYLGHSMGSFLLRYYMSKHTTEKSIIMGTGYINNFSAYSLLFLSSLISLFKGDDYTSSFIINLTTDKFGKMVNGEKYDWISYNKENISQYINDPYCNFDFTLNGYKTLSKCIIEINKKSTIKKTDPNTNILFISGKDDPVGNFKKGVIKVYNKYKKAGFKNIKLKLLDNMRHEILNEENRHEVYDILLNFINKKTVN